mmetsp:Transcript_11918/g.35691  ORF Transcript_11918/g.35691 Transcript_11918/m.35691 type:complete len:203 (-) Transcript_11918:117-725(-)
MGSQSVKGPSPLMNYRTGPPCIPACLLAPALLTRLPLRQLTFPQSCQTAPPMASPLVCPLSRPPSRLSSRLLSRLFSPHSSRHPQPHWSTHPACNTHPARSKWLPAQCIIMRMVGPCAVRQRRSQTEATSGGCPSRPPSACTCPKQLPPRGGSRTEHCASWCCHRGGWRSCPSCSSRAPSASPRGGSASGTRKGSRQGRCST